MTHRWINAMAMAVLMATAAAADAQSVRYGGGSPTNFSAVNLGSSGNLTPTITVLNAGDQSALTTVSVTGAGFTQAGGTCVPGFVVTNATPCTLQLRFTPGAPGVANGNLSINCATLVPIGGVTITCNGVGSVIALIGTGVAAALEAKGIPALSPLGLTLLALILVIAMMLTMQRRGHGLKRSR